MLRKFVKKNPANKSFAGFFKMLFEKNYLEIPKPSLRASTNSKRSQPKN